MSKKESFFNKYLGGSIFSRRVVVKQLPFILYVVFLLMLYISNTYIAEDMRRDIKKKNDILKDKRIECVSIESNIKRLSMQSELAKRLKSVGIKESVEPVRRIVVNKDNINE